MRLYVKLAVLAVLAFGGQAVVANGAFGDAYFAVRCYVAHAAGDRAMEQQLICEFEEKLAIDNGAVVAVAYNAAASDS